MLGDFFFLHFLIILGPAQIGLKVLQRAGITGVHCELPVFLGG